MVLGSGAGSSFERKCVVISIFTSVCLVVVLACGAVAGTWPDQSCETILVHVRRAPTTHSGRKVKTNLMRSLPQKKESAPRPDGLPCSVYRFAGRFCSHYFLTHTCSCLTELYPHQRSQPAEQYLFRNLAQSMTRAGLCDLLMHGGRQHCA